MSEGTPETREIPKAYDPKLVEQRLYQFWLSKGLFTPAIDQGKRPFVIILPPPNVTGELHLGHALTATLEDIMVRWHRMLGEPALWLPGTDHAGIATQVVVERELAKEGLTRHQLGREGFLERMWEWVGRYGRIITEQHKRLGVSFDWSRERFTLDPGPSKAVRHTFVNLYKKGLIYRGERIINWCVRCATALSDLEVEHQQVDGNLYYIRYPLAEGQGHITVATTRPETLLGDTAVAVNPEDKRYRAVVGQEAVLPVLKRRLPVIADEAVQMEFGTGALKITPGHDPTDFEVGQRHGLPIVVAIDPDGMMNREAGPYSGMDRAQCRKAIVEELEREGLLEKVEPYVHTVGHCQRCRQVVEPLVSEQWFVKAAVLARPAIEAVEKGDIRIIPEHFIKTYLHWMYNIKDWCISRQLWWGHRIPVWYCRSCKQMTVEYQDPKACGACGSGDIYQDPDVLDTWFSSALWPHSTLGWPDDTEDLRYFYPTSVMETGYDILFFWVARMIMMGLENTGKPPFHTVYLHGLVRDVEGQKMSKTRGNVIDPIQAIDTYGCDALRFALTIGVAAGSDQRLGPSKLEAGRNFANKLWNASRFILMELQGATSLGGWRSPIPTHREDRWILSRLHRLVSQVDRQMKECLFGEAEQAIYEFFWGEFCDWYIEMAKVRLRQGDSLPLPVLVHVLERVLRLLHPFTPFVTEEIWQALKPHLASEAALPESLAIAEYPRAAERFVDAQAEEEIGLVIALIQAIRNVRADYRIKQDREVEAEVVVNESLTHAVLSLEKPLIEKLATSKLNVRPIGEAGDRSPIRGPAIHRVLNGTHLMVPLEGVVDVKGERERLERELAQSEENMRRLELRLADPEFRAKAPAEVIEREEGRRAASKDRREKIEGLLRELGG
ncbi:MAG: valine--tRNA ligase [Chloroflexi bacterium]|nr:valine--tRNA ligase [Chloroflexota bacterium]